MKNEDLTKEWIIQLRFMLKDAEENLVSFYSERGYNSSTLITLVESLQTQTEVITSYLLEKEIHGESEEV